MTITCNVRMTFEICPGFSLGCMVHSANITTKTNMDALIIRITVANCRESQSQWPRFLRRRSAAARLLGLWVRITPGAWMFVSCECCVLSGRGLCVGLITRPEGSYRLWCVWVWSWILHNQEALTHGGAVAILLNKNPFFSVYDERDFQWEFLYSSKFSSRN